MPPASCLRMIITLTICLMIIVLAGPAPLLAQEQLSTEQIKEMLAAGESLAGANLGPAQLPGISLDGVSLDSTIWAGADLRGAEFSKVSLKAAQVTATNARGARFADCDLSRALFQDSDLAGASFTNVLLWGTTLTNTNLRGAHLEGVSLSPCGAPHLMALSLALGPLAGGPATNATHPLAAPAIVAGLSGDAFSFVYDPENPGAGPGQPFTQNPIIAAAEVLGCEAEPYWRLSQAVAFKKLRTALDSGKVCVLPLKIAIPGTTGNGLEKPFWAVASELVVEGGEAVCHLNVPPFGEMLLPAAELDDRWQQAQVTLQPPTAQPPEVRYPLIILSPPTRPLSQQQTALWALGRAARLMTATNAGSQTTLYPGLEGLQKLSADLADANAADDGVRLIALAAWENRPRLSLIGARRAAADFLDAVSDNFLPQQAELLADTVVLLRSEAAMLDTQWQPFARGKLAAMTAKEAIEENLQVLAEVHAVEQQVLTNLEDLIGAR